MQVRTKYASLFSPLPPEDIRWAFLIRWTLNIVVVSAEAGAPTQFTNASTFFLFFSDKDSYGSWDSSATAGKTHVVRIWKAFRTSFRLVASPQTSRQPS